MAIEFARQEILSAANHSAVAKAAYNGREKARDFSAGTTFDFTHHSDLIDSGFVLPKDAPEWAGDTARLWNEAQSREYVTDRKTGEVRLSKHGNPQVAKDITLALPRELSDEQNLQLLHEYIAVKFAGAKVAVQWAIHRDEGNHNPHAHLLVSTRQLSGTGFGKKARELNPDFVQGRIIKDNFARQWADFQNEFFRQRGIELVVEPPRVVPDAHLGKARFLDESEREKQRAARAAEARAIIDDPAKLLEHATKRTATFTLRDLDYHLKKAGLDEIERQTKLAEVMRRPELVTLEGQRFTTRSVLEQEKAVAASAQRLVQSDRHGVSNAARRSAVASRTLDGEQRVAFDYATSSKGLAVVQGRAGTGKSYTMGAIRETYERDGYRVVGLAPTNTVAADMRADGFKEGRTLASEMLRLDHGHTTWDARTVVVVDEMGMVSTRAMEGLLRRAEEAGAKVVGFGDERQLQSVERGGMFGHVAREAGAVELSTVRRQKDEWQRTASEAAARGDLAGAISAYGERGGIQWSGDLDQARADLVRDWKESVRQQPDQLPFVYAATNDAVASLNDAMREARQELGQIGTEERSFVTEKGDRSRETRVSVGDRVQITKSVRDRAIKLDLRNGEFGQVERIDGDRMTIRIDEGRMVSFDARQHRGWDLGYASTIYKGQGKTQKRVWALHDSPYAWRTQTSYVALTRHTDELKLYANRAATPTTADLSRKMARSDAVWAAMAFRDIEVDRCRDPRSEDRELPRERPDQPGQPLDFFANKERLEREDPQRGSWEDFFANKERLEREGPERVERERDRDWDRDR